MSLEVYINDSLLELKNPKTIGLTFQVGSVFNPSGRNGDLTNSIAVPKTRANNIIFENLGNLNADGRIPYKRNSAKIIQNGIELVSDGIAVVDSTTKDDYNVVIYSGNVTFFDLIKELNISDLDWSNSVHNFDIATILASFNNTDKYIYPIVDYATNGSPDLLNNTDTQNADALLPCAFVSDILERSALEAGYELKGTFKDLDVYNRLVLTPNSFGFSQDEVNENTGLANTVTALNDSVLVEDSITDPSAFLFNFPITFNNIVGSQYSNNAFTPTNNFIGTFTFNATGSIDSNVPQSTEKVVHTATTGYTGCVINDTHIAYVRNGGAGIEVVLYDIIADTEIVLDDSIATTARLTMTETTGGFVAWSFAEASGRDVSIYEIATATTTEIYNDTGAGQMDYLHISGGRLVWLDNVAGRGIFMYDFATTTTKNVTTETNIYVNAGVYQIDHNGEYIVWGEVTPRDVLIWDYTTATEVIIETMPNPFELGVLDVIGDYVTYWNGKDKEYQSYRISTDTLVTIIGVNPKTVDGAARTDTHVSFGTNQGDIYYYDLVNDTLLNTTELQANVSDNFDISMNDDYIVYIAETNKKVKVYDIALNSISEIAATTDSYTKICITKNNQIFYHNEGNTDELTIYNLNVDAISLVIPDIEDVDCFQKAELNDRLVYSTTSIDARIAYLNPLAQPIEVDLHVAIKEDGVVIYEETQTFNTSGVVGFNKKLNTGEVVVEAGKVYTAEIFMEADRAGTLDYSIGYILSTAGFRFAMTNKIPYGAEVPFGILWDYKQNTFWKDIINMYNLTIQTNEITKQVFLSPLNDLNTNLNRAKDWSTKIDLSKPINTKYSLNNYGQKNYLDYTIDDDIPLYLGRNSFDVNDINLPKTKNIIELSLASSEYVFRVEDEHTPKIPLKDLTDSSFEKAKNRILLLDPIDKTVNFENTVNADTGVASTNIPFSYFDKFGKTDNLTFGSLVDDYYSSLIGMLTDTKVIVASFLLSEVDVLNIDFTIPIYLDVHSSEVDINGYFYINKISNFKSDSVTQVQLIRL